MSAASSDCVKVAVRVRPMVASELSRGCIQIIEKTAGQPQLSVTGETHSKTQDYYTYNDVYMPIIGQEEVYDTSVQPIIGKLFEGYNVTILAYGQTGSGKTYTMGTCFGGNWDSPDTGIIPRALQQIFTQISELQEAGAIIHASCSFMELYQENLFDLISGKSRESSVCEIREDSQKGIIISGLTEVTIEDAVDASKYLISGGDKRSVGATAMNDVSSRSHAIFTINVEVQQGGTSTKAKFHLVDLAGSERSKKTKATGTRFKEGVKINQGLLALGNVISALGGGQGAAVGFVSYRDSKLTRLLQDSLGGNSVTLMIACVSPADYNIEETLSTLRYADRAKKIKNKPIKNQDSHESEIWKYKVLIHDLRVKLLDYANIDGTPIYRGETKHVFVCGEDCIQEKARKETETKEIRLQLSSLFSVINDLNSRHLIEETFYTELIERFEKLRDMLDNACPAEFAMPDTKIFEEIKKQTQEITGIIAKFRLEFKDSAENDFNVDDNSCDDDASHQKRLEYTQTQMQSLLEIQQLERNMKIKQELLDRKFQSTPYLIDETEKTMIEYQETIKNLEKELVELKGGVASSAARRDHNTTKVNMDRKHRVDKLEKDLEETRKKCVNLEKTKKLAEQDRKRIDELRREIQGMKNARVKLIRQQRSDGDQYKKWIATRDKEINVLKEKGKKVQNEMKRMERMHDKQQAVLKRKVEEAKAVNKRLQDAMDRNKKVQSMRASSKVSEKFDVIQTYIDHELMVLMSTIDAKIAMQSLMNDRGLLNERLLNLKSTVNKNDAINHEIKQLEEDLEMRNTQIMDIRQKVMQTDIDAKMKSIPDNFSSVQEVKVAMGYVLRAVLDTREDFINSKTKTEDLKVAYETSEERIEQLTEELNKKIDESERLKSEMENDFELKLSYMYQLNTAASVVGSKEDTNSPVFKSMVKQISDVIEKNKALAEQNEALQKQLEEKIKKKSRKDRPQTNETYVTAADEIVDEVSSEEVIDSSDEFEINDSFADPDWVKTPMQKRMSKRTTSMLKESVTNRMDGTGLLANISETSDTSNSRKRSASNANKCSCKGSCATKLCGCKKNSTFCSPSVCKCSDACVNRPGDSDESFEKENDSDVAEVTPSKKQSKMDFSTITTPYYPYDSKKRKPLLQM